VADHLLRLWGLACLLPRWQVKRLYRLKEYERSLAEEALDKKNHRLDHVIGSKKQSIVERKKRAQDFVVKKQLLKEEAAKTMRSASAPPGGVQLTAQQQRALANRMAQPKKSSVVSVQELLFGPQSSTVAAF
jgi:hypothetical protein